MQRQQIPFTHSIVVRIQGEDANMYPYMNSEENCTTISTRVPGQWLMMSRYYGRGTRNIEQGVCFHEGVFGNQLEPSRPSVHLEFTLDGDLLGVVEIPLRSEQIRQEFPDCVMWLPNPVPVGQNRLHLLGLSLRDIRSTPDYEISAIHFAI